jgi:hypothetical protein
MIRERPVMMKLLATIISVFALFAILFGALYMLQNKRAYYLPEGFTSDAIEYPSEELNEVKNPLTKIMKKLTKMGTFLLDKNMWDKVIANSNLSPMDLARKQIEADKKTIGK